MYCCIFMQSLRDICVIIFVTLSPLLHHVFEKSLELLRIGGWKWPLLLLLLWLWLSTKNWLDENYVCVSLSLSLSLCLCVYMCVCLFFPLFFVQKKKKKKCRHGFNFMLKCVFKDLRVFISFDLYGTCLLKLLCCIQNFNILVKKV